MASTNFYLDKKTGRNESPIFLYFRYAKSKRVLKYNTGLRIDEKYWDQKKQRAKRTGKFPNHPEFNQSLTNLTGYINNIFRTYQNDNIKPTNKLLKVSLDKVYKNIQPEKEYSELRVIEYIDKFIEQSKGKKQKGTIKTYVSARNHLFAFQKLSKGKLEFDDITSDFKDDFVKYLTQIKKLRKNTVEKYIQTLKVFLANATEAGANTNMDFKKRSFIEHGEPSENIYLNTKEIEILFDLDLNKEPRLAKVRDLFLIGCYTGLRYSDLAQLNANNIVKDENEHYYIKVHTLKTNAKVTIPLKKNVLTILERNNGEIPNVISNQKMNDYLKEIGEKAGFNTPIEKVSHIGVEKIVETLPKYKFITTHTARRSFATNAYKSNVPTLSIMKMTGHRSEHSFLKYIKVTDEENAQLLRVHPFFQ